MRNSFSNRLLRWLCVGEIIMLIALWLVSCIVSFYVEGVETVLSSSGFRWAVANMMGNFELVPLEEILCGLFAVSVLRESGIFSALSGHVSLRQKRALQITGLFLSVALFLFSLTLFLPNAILLSAFGTLNNSPLLKGLFGIVWLFALLIGNVYGYASGRIANISDCINAHVAIFRSVAPYFIVLFLASQLVGTLDYSNLLMLIGK